MSASVDPVLLLWYSQPGEITVEMAHLQLKSKRESKSHLLQKESPASESSKGRFETTVDMLADPWSVSAAASDGAKTCRKLVAEFLFDTHRHLRLNSIHSQKQIIFEVYALR